MRHLLRGAFCAVGMMAFLLAAYVLINEVLTPVVYNLLSWAMSLGDAVAFAVSMLLVALPLSAVAAVWSWWAGEGR